MMISQFRKAPGAEKTLTITILVCSSASGWVADAICPDQSWIDRSQDLAVQVFSRSHGRRKGVASGISACAITI